jgi:hypothetical protein
MKDVTSSGVFIISPRTEPPVGGNYPIECTLRSQHIKEGNRAAANNGECSVALTLLKKLSRKMHYILDTPAVPEPHAQAAVSTKTMQARCLATAI